jgi:two-component system cell cycle response regulator DivK
MSKPEHEDESTPPPQGNGELVLVVEDNEKNARLTMAMLEAGGYRTRLAVDGNEGRDLALALTPDVIVTDLQMPGLDGLAMTRALRERPETRHIPIVAVSAHALNEHRQQALAAGCHGFLTKPFRFRALLSEVAAARSPAATG